MADSEIGDSDHGFVEKAGVEALPGTCVEALATWFTPQIRNARALGFDNGGRTSAVKANATNAISATKPHRILLFFIFGVTNVIPKAF